MATKRAAGFVIYRKVADGIQYLLLQTSYGTHHWTPPKGHVDPGETDLETAYRETMEESGIVKEQVFVHEDAKFELSYPVKGIPKTSVYWLAKLLNPNSAVILSDEHINFKWLPLDEACTVSNFVDFHNMLHKCQKYLDDKS